tara:strand:+ start:193 stop:558 length:366 start_codon:yes stop_codon:yes gene_type:complete
MTTYYKIHVMCDKNCQKCTYTSGWQKKNELYKSEIMTNGIEWYTTNESSRRLIGNVYADKVCKYSELLFEAGGYYYTITTTNPPLDENLDGTSGKSWIDSIPTSHPRLLFNNRTGCFKIIR